MTDHARDTDRARRDATKPETRADDAREKTGAREKPEKRADDAREARLAEALRANLRRRKSQAKAREAGEPPAGTGGQSGEERDPDRDQDRDLGQQRGEDHAANRGEDGGGRNG